MIDFKLTKDFGKQFKRLLKKYRTLPEDLTDLTNQLSSTPTMGIDLGNGVRKIRLAIRSKAKGKRSGLRVIAHIDVIIETNEGVITYLYLYDKSEMANISDEKIAEILKELIN